MDYNPDDRQAPGAPAPENAGKTGENEPDFLSSDYYALHRTNIHPSQQKYVPPQFVPSAPRRSDLFSAAHGQPRPAPEAEEQAHAVAEAQAEEYIRRSTEQRVVMQPDEPFEQAGTEYLPAHTQPGANGEFAFKVRNLTKYYGKHLVLDDISFDIPSGKIVGLLGPNGCGKTTLMKILVGLINDYSGIVKVNGRNIGISSKAHTAYLPEATYFEPRMRTIDCIDYFNDFFFDFDREKALDFAKRFGLEKNQRIKTMSKGMQEKLQLLIVMSRKADIYILDEPLGGVDPAARSVILDIIMSNYKENATLMLSTHLVNDLEHSFDHILMLGRGSVLVNTGIDNLRATGKSVEEIFKEVIGDAWEVD